MSAKILAVAVALVVLPASSAFASSLLTNGGFDDVLVQNVGGLVFPYINSPAYAYPGGPGGPGTVGSWTYVDGATGGAGGLVQVVSPGSVNPYFQGPAAQSGNQYAFLQDDGSFSQTFTSPSAGTATVAWYEASRQNEGSNGSDSGAEKYEVILNGAVLGTFTTPQSLQPFTLESVLGTLKSGSNTLEFLGLVHYPPADETAFIDSVSVAATPLPSTWTMLIAGFVGLGLVACFASKRHRVSAVVC